MGLAVMAMLLGGLTRPLATAAVVVRLDAGCVVVMAAMLLFLL